MTLSREQRLQATIDRLALELARERAAHRRTAEERDWAEEKARVLQRVIERLADAKSLPSDAKP